MEFLRLDDNKNIDPSGFQHIADIIHFGNVKELTLRNCELTNDKLHAFKIHLERRDIKGLSLILDKNKYMEPEAFGAVAELLSMSQVDTLSIAECDLDDNKLNVLQERMENRKMEVSSLLIDNRNV